MKNKKIPFFVGLNGLHAIVEISDDYLCFFMGSYCGF